MTTPEDRVVEALPECEYLGIDYNGHPLAPCGKCAPCTARAMAGVVKAAREFLGYCDNCGGNGVIGAMRSPCSWCSPLRAALTTLDTPEEPTTP